MNVDYSVYISNRAREEETYANVFDVIVSHGDWPALQWSRSKTPGDHAIVTFEQTEYVAEYIADKLIDMLDGCEKTFVGIKADNCPEYPVVFWGILMAGYKPFLLDCRHNVQLTEFFLKQTKAVALITKQPCLRPWIKSVP